MDTIRPKLEKNANLNQETVQNANSNRLEDEENTTPPEFPGGTNQLRNIVSKKFDGSKINPSKEIYKANLSYVVNEKGNVVDVVVSGNNVPFNEEVKSSFIKSTEGITWKPAEKDGKQVRYRMRMPMTIAFE